MKLQVLSTTQRLRATIDNLRIEATVNTTNKTIESATITTTDDNPTHLGTFNSTPDAINYHLTTHDPTLTTQITNAILTFITTTTE